MSWGNSWHAGQAVYYAVKAMYQALFKQIPAMLCMQHFSAPEQYTFFYSKANEKELF